MLRGNASDKRSRCCHAKSRRSARWQQNIVDAGAGLRARSVPSRIFSVCHVMLHVKKMAWKEVEVVKAFLEFVIVAPEGPNYLRGKYTDSARRDGACFFDFISSSSFLLLLSLLHTSHHIFQQITKNQLNICRSSAGALPLCSKMRPWRRRYLQ